jgi:putative two-component system hydrogenase maturation factor HypX/HoxX
MQQRMDAPTNFRDVLRRSPSRLRGELPPPVAEKPLRILFVTSAHNSLSQRAYIALREMGHDVTVQVVDSPEIIEAAVHAHEPDLVVCPMLKQFIPESVWSKYTCLVVHPGPHGDRGPSSLDWAIELGFDEWGVTVLEAVEEADAGDIWETRKFKMRPVGKSSIYRHEVRRAAVEMLVFAVHNFARGDFKPLPLSYEDPNVTGRLRPLIKQADRAIDWRSDSTAGVVRKIRAAEGHPGVLDTIGGAEFHLFNVHVERGLRGRPGEIIATRNGAICRATVDGAVWITHLKAKEGAAQYKLPATRSLELAAVVPDAPEIPVALHAPIPPGYTYREISYEEKAGVGYLNFDFYNGAMSTEQCRRLREAYLYARSRRSTKVIVLAGGSDFFSNGIHLNVIEAAADPAEESWYNLHAIDDVVREILETDSHLTISALSGDAAAGGVPFAAAADHVVAREDVVLNPYYQHMGGLYGSEYWTYLLPRRVGAEMAQELTSAPFTPIGTRHAVEIGLLDATFGDTSASFRAQVQGLAERLARHPDFGFWLEQKRHERARDEQIKPLAVYRTEEMARSHECFFGENRSYHAARSLFVHKTGAPCTVLLAARREPELTEAQRAVTKVRPAKQSVAR